MQLRLSAVAPASAAGCRGGLVDLRIEAAPGMPVREVADRLRRLVGATGPMYVGGAPLDDRAPLGSPPLVEGATVTVGVPAGSDRLRGVLQLRVAGGPDAGRTHYLEPGRVVIGRAAGAGVRVEDPDVSRAHAELEVTWDGVTVRDLGSTNGTTVGGHAVGGQPHPLPPGVPLRTGATTSLLVSPDVLPAATAADAAGHLALNRPPRLPPPVPEVEITLPAPPAERDRPRLPLIGMLLPLVAGVAMAALLRNPTFLLFTLLAPLMLLGQFLSDRSARSKQARASRREHSARTQAVAARIAEATAAERVARLAEAPDPAELLTLALGPGSRLWERRPADADALLVRVGLADLPAWLRVLEPSRDASLAPRAPEVLSDVPVTVPLTEVGSLGVGGPRVRTLALARWVVAQLAALHSPRDLSLVVLAPGAADDWSWSRWLPHVAPSHGEEATALLGLDEGQVDRRVAELLAQLEARQTALAGRTLCWSGPRTVVVLDGSRRLRAVPGVARLLSGGPAVGLHALCLAEDAVSLPAECGARASVTGDVGTGLHVEVRDRAPVDGVRLDGVGAGWAERLARALAPLRDATPDDGQAALPSSARLLDLLAGEPEAAMPTPQEVAAGWVAAPRSTAAVLGVSRDGPFAVDLRRDGPHALVAGTTGSGKSELLQTLVASLAVANRPDAMVFVLVDYKGGAAFAECARLPHTVGLVTDLDGHLTERALASLDAELKRRERVLGQAGAKDLDGYLAQARAGAEAIPRLVLLVDEFATLVEELPDFVRGLVGVAQRGRSLGVHLVLATQRPAGVVSADIRANTCLRIAMRVTDDAESQDVVDARDAALISRRTPGRGFARRGAEPLVAFQTARVGGPPPRARTSPVSVTVDDPRRLGDPRARPAAGLLDRAAGSVRTDLAGLVDGVRIAAERLGLAPPASPWLPPLPDRVAVADLPELPPAADVPLLPYALADLPGRQQQVGVGLDLADGAHLMAVGSPRSGRSTLLRTLAGQIGLLTSPADVHLYGLDCGNGALLPLAGLPHCGAVVAGESAERADRLLTRLAEECRRRQGVLARDGYADLAEQRAHASPADRLPYLVLFIDRWEGFLATLDEVDAGRLTDLVLGLLREGPAAGLRVVVTADRAGLVGRVGSLVEHKLVLRLADRADAGLAGLAARDLPDAMPPGRAVRAGDGVELQLALPGSEPGGPAQVAHLREVAARAHAGSFALATARRPFRVDELPVSVPWPAPGAGDPPEPARLAALLGVGGDELAGQWVDLAAEGPGVVVAGPPRSGRSTALVGIALSLLECGHPLVLVAPRPSPLRGLRERPGVRAMLSGAEQDLATFEAAVVGAGPLAVVVDDGELLVDSALACGLEAFLRTARDLDRALVVGGTTSELQGGFRGYVVEARKSRTGLLLAAVSPLDGDLLGVRLPRSLVGGGPVGRGALVVRGRLTPVQVADARPDQSATIAPERRSSSRTGR